MMQAHQHRCTPKFEVQVPNEFQCPVCLEPKIPFVTFTCGHSTCGRPQCAPALQRCPECRKPVTERIVMHQLADMVARSVQLSCKALGCTWSGNEAAAATHVCPQLSEGGGSNPSLIRPLTSSTTPTRPPAPTVVTSSFASLSATSVPSSLHFTASPLPSTTSTAVASPMLPPRVGPGGKAKLGSSATQFDLNHIAIDALEELSIRNCDHITDLRVLAMQCPRLRKLVLYNAAVTQLGIEGLEVLPLEEIDMSGCHSITDLRAFRSCPTLRKLYVHNSAVTQNGIRGLQELPLQEVYIGACASIVDVSALMCPTLQLLNGERVR